MTASWVCARARIAGWAGWRCSTCFDRPLRGRDALFKRGFDLVLGGVLMVVALPLMALIALAIRLDSPGPILFRQLREGYVGAPFTALKFRSLHHALRDDSARNPRSAQ